ncbi:tyrosine-protein phosphatase [Lacihabitans sp. CCS-44]|uniref:tyrosine-protein phosphatase n=1 Tax=Lacihabitans sp. CCS-44 TaxID=2487331 RepID=UPI0020CCE20F|nr:tyrosine-protein phosphatase [Lacihabitans sp. CCS-44]MCP9757329.1 tyrosine-protein phosphatase [Lacihabitans sp. CCS-44]
MKKIVLFVLVSLGAFSQNAHLSTEVVWAARVSASKYVLHNTTKKKIKIFAGNTQREINWKQSSRILKDSLIVNVNADNRLFFGTIIKKDTVVFSERRLWMENAPNFRDLGGLKTTEGKTVVWGKLFRCGDMGKLSESDLAAIKREKIRNVVDFRNEQEIKQSPDKYPAEYEMNRVWTSISPSNGEAMKQFYAIIGNPNTTKEDASKVFEGFYAKMPENIKNYEPFFKTLLNSKMDEASLFHCTAGKDRTGLGSALILSALGVPENTIIEEYYLSNRYTQYLAKSGMMGQLKPEIAAVLAGVEPKYIQSSLNAIKLKYGSVLKMLETELGIDEAKLNTLKAKYTY